MSIYILNKLRKKSVS